jgi:hypothetical protein
MIKQLTEEQLALLPEIRDEWIAYALNAPTVTPEGDVVYNAPPPITDKETNIAWIYSLADLKAPPVFEVESPLAMQFSANILESYFDTPDTSKEECVVSSLDAWVKSKAA